MALATGQLDCEGKKNGCLNSILASAEQCWDCHPLLFSASPSLPANVPYGDHSHHRRDVQTQPLRRLCTNNFEHDDAVSRVLTIDIYTYMLDVFLICQHPHRFHTYNILSTVSSLLLSIAKSHLLISSA